MLAEIKALLHRYWITYFRFPGRPIRDFLFAIIIGGGLLIRNFDALGILGLIIFYMTIPFTFLVIVRTMLGEIVSEKASGVKEYLKLNGLGNVTYQLYLLVITSAKTIFFTAFVVGGLLLGNVLTLGSVINKALDEAIDDFVVLYVLCALATISFVLFFSVMFSDPKVSSSVGGVLYVLISLASFAVLSLNSPYATYAVSLFPQAGLTLGLMIRVVGVKGVGDLDQIKMVLIMDFFVYLILFMYFDQVVADENGVSKGFFFCLDCKKRRDRRVPRQPDDQQELARGLVNETEGAEEDWSSAVFHERLTGVQNLEKTVQINHLYKNFGSFTAVDDISFSIYSGQIFCLLGHNGAGKTTTIKMLTGLLEIDSGEVMYDGEDFLSNFEEARKKIGICSQNDVLFEKFTVTEHLELIAKLRGIPFFDIPDAVEQAIQRVNLTNERAKYSEELSGGNKRKLSLAMAVLGETKVVFLDEPTSGMDPQNRRVMWHHLKQLKEQGMTILLTTHHLDEADELADRIAIMSKGKLLAVGTSEYFKKNFGVGYHLNLTPNYNEIQVDAFIAGKPEFRKIISEVIPVAQFDEQTAVDVVKCSLPFTSQGLFPRLFAQLESLRGVRISVEMNTLEDVFVNIGLSEDKLLHGGQANAEINIHTEPPACLSQRHEYSFFAQVFALAKRRVYLLTRSKRNLFLMLLPLIMILFSTAGSYFWGTAGADSGKFTFFLVIVFLAYALNTGVYCSLPVYEREDKLKYIMDVMGLRNLPYWIGNLLVDFFAISLMNVAIFGFYLWFYNALEASQSAFVMIPTPVEFLTFLIPHGLAIVTIGYAFSFLFGSALSAVKYFPLLYFFGLFLPSLMVIARISLSGSESTSILILIACVMCPSTTMWLFFLGKLAGNKMDLTLPNVVIALCAHSAFYFLITLALESRRLSKAEEGRANGWSAHEPVPIPVDQNDVQFEQNRTFQTPQDPIKVMNLSKVYDNGYTAVKNVTFGVSPGQIFGLLGPNGAGKSSTFNILTAANNKSSGFVQLLGQEINKNMPEVFENVGICPQFNALWDFLTVQEHLTLFGNLKGLRGDELDQVVNYYLDVLQLREHANKRAEELSGGNKRKLSVANAFIGTAHLLFLDEPSTGVDPLARRFLWNSIQQVLKMRQASVVLTTHSMYEAESLSHKIGILINGRFVCIGPTQYLKDKYSHGYKVTVSLVSGAADPSPKVLEIFPLATRVHESSYVQMTYHIPFEGFRFSDAFEKLEGLKASEVIKDFSIYNTTLEQIFIYFSRFQINVGGNGQ